MAEYVQQSIEDMLPELEQMERVGICTGVETKKILKHRKNLEYKIRRRTKCKEDFLQYVQYEVGVLKLVRTRREKIGYHNKKKEIDVPIVNRIHNLFRLVTNRFPDDVKLWLSYIEFSKSRNEKSNVSRLFTKMLQIHNKKPDLWILAAKWELETNNSAENARHLLQMALRYLNTNQQLWLEYFRMELLYTEKLRQRRSVLGVDEASNETEDISDGVLEGHVADIVYKKALEAIPDNVDFVLSFLSVCKLFDFTLALQQQIFSDLKSKFSDKPQTWDALAKEHLYTLPYTEENEEKFHQVYKVALTETVIPKDVIWKYYLTGCLELIEEEHQTLGIIEKRIQKALSLFETANEENHLNEELCFKWVSVLIRVGLIDKALIIIKKAVIQHSKSVMLWKQYIQLVMRSTLDDTEAIRIFKESQKHIPEKVSLELWNLILDFCISCQSQQTEGLFEKAISGCREVAVPLKEHYLQWMYLTKGVNKARNLFQRLIQTKPHSLQLFNEYFKIENSQPLPKIKFLRKAFEDAVMEYGSDDADLWISYIKLEMNHHLGNPENIGSLHYRAAKQLEGELLGHFITQFTLLQTGHEIIES